MKNLAIILLLVMFGLTSCTVIEGIFKAGVWVGILAVVGVVVLLIYLFTRFRKK